MISSWISSWIFELDFRVGFFRVGFSSWISSWIFELDFRVGFRVGFRVRIFWRFFFGGFPINFQWFYTTYFVSGVAHRLEEKEDCRSLRAILFNLS